VTIINRSPVLSASHYNAWISVRANGKVIAKKPLDKILLEPGASMELDLSPYLPRMQKGIEYHADIEFTTKEDKAWAAKGFVVASNQLSLTPLAPPFDMHAS